MSMAGLPRDDRRTACGSAGGAVGGSRREDPEQLLREIGAGLAAGARGVVIGRNLGQSSDVEATLERLQALM